MKRISQLDGVRGVAIILVLIYHYLACSIAAEPDTALYHAVAVLNLTWCGVDLFFVLSGFLIVGILCDHRQSANYFSVFYLRRICRIFPLYYLLFILFLVVRHAGLPPDTRDWLFSEPLPLWSYATFTQNIFMGLRGDFGPHWLGITWSLAVEEQFYIFIPLLVYLLPRKILFAVLVIGVLSAPLLRGLSPGFHAFVNTPWRSDSLLTGGCLAILVRWHPFISAVQRHRHSLSTLFFIFLIGAGVMALKPAWFGVMNHFWLAGLFGILILMGFLWQDGWVAPLLNNRVLVWFGRLSYGIYMFHQAVSGLLHGLILQQRPQIITPMDAFVTFIALLATLALAQASFQLMENPILQFGHRFRYRPHTLPETSATDRRNVITTKEG